MHILLIGARLCRNLGGPSLLVATRRVLSERFPGAQYTLLVPAASAQEDSALEEVYQIRCVPYRPSPLLAMVAVLRLLGLRLRPRSLRPMLDVFERADVVIDIWGIGFSDALGSRSFRSRFASGLHFLLAKALRKPVIKYTADYGPLATRWNRFFARLYLGRCIDLILARDAQSRDAVASLGIRTPVYVCPDTAFMLEPQPSAMAISLAERRRTQPIIGLSVSHQIDTRSRGNWDYVGLMAGLADHVVAATGAHVVLIANELAQAASADDARIAQAVLDRMAARTSAQAVTAYRSASELKGVIQQCDAVVAARYHTLVAALSMGIPSLAVGWHHKYEGLLGLVGQERFACDYQTLSLSGLTALFDDLWANREAISETITAHLPAITQQVMAGAEHAATVLASRRQGAMR
jgi:colanic acid/amylovoran biosynthesis protein